MDISLPNFEYNGLSNSIRVPWIGVFPSLGEIGLFHRKTVTRDLNVTEKASVAPRNDQIRLEPPARAIDINQTRLLTYTPTRLRQTLSDIACDVVVAFTPKPMSDPANLGYMSQIRRRICPSLGLTAEARTSCPTVCRTIVGRPTSASRGSGKRPTADLDHFNKLSIGKPAHLPGPLNHAILRGHALV